MRFTEHWVQEVFLVEQGLKAASAGTARSSAIHQRGRARQLICLLQFHLQPRKMSHHHTNYVWQGRTNCSNQIGSGSDNSWKKAGTQLHLEGIRGWEDAPGRTTRHRHCTACPPPGWINKHSGRNAMHLQNTDSLVLIFPGSLLHSQGDLI